MPLSGVLDPRNARPGVRADLRAWLALQAVGALRPQQAAQLLDAHASPKRALRAFARAGVVDAGYDVAKAVRRLAAIGAVAVPSLSPAYPPRLARLADPPPLLLVRGDVAALRRRAVAVVGARAATSYGRGVARDLGAALAGQGLAVVSGLAYGVDAEAHLGALDAAGCTIAVQGCGPDRVYPARHRELADRIVERGAVVSELPPGFPPRRGHFPLRNRLIAGLAECVVVVEARERSGSLSTARHALDQGSDVLAVPGPITAPTSAGTNRLLAEGAAPFLHVDDVLQLLHLPLTTAPPARAELVPGVRGIAVALLHEPATPDELGRRLDSHPGKLAAALLGLELEGFVGRDPDGRLRWLGADPG